MTDNKCNCRSYNGDFGETPEAVLPIPKHFGPHYYASGQRKETVCVDACIAHVIQHLWDNHVWTENSCCGHNGKSGPPGIILPGAANREQVKEQASEVRRLIAQVDNREFKLQAWVLAEV